MSEINGIENEQEEETELLGRMETGDASVGETIGNPIWNAEKEGAGNCMIYRICGPFVCPEALQRQNSPGIFVQRRQMKF